MKFTISRLSLLVACLLWTTAPLAADRPPIVGISHVAFQVSDLEKARTFYGELLGFDEAGRLSKSDGTIEAAYFKVGDRQFIEIHPGLPKDQDERLLHFGLETTDAAGLRSYLQEKGVAVPPAVEPGRDGNLAFETRDPDGHRVRFVQYRPGSLHSKLKGRHLSARRISDRILHVGITVADPAAADRFYKDILGLSEIWRGGQSETVTSWINMRLPESTDYIEYMLVTGKVDRQRLGVLHHVALKVPDMQKAFDTLRERPMGRDPVAVRPPQVGRNNRWLLNMYDPDGTRTELMEPFTMR